MIPVTQTEFGYPKGNCLQAGTASILEVELSDLPDLFELTCVWWEAFSRWIHHEWWEIYRKGVQDHGWAVLTIKAVENNPDWYPQGYSLAGGKSPRDVVDESGENVGHVVVCLDGEIVHDPHPSGDGLAGPIEEWYVFFPPYGWRPEG